MREIQDLTIQRTRIAERLDDLLAERRKSFLQWIVKAPTGNGIATGCRMSLVPTSEIYVPSLYRNTTALPTPRNFRITFDDGGSMKVITPDYFYERPIIRGTRRSNDKLNPDFVLEAYSSGLIEILHRDISPTPKFYMSWVLGVLCNGLFMAESFRRAANVPEAEYAFELEIASTNPTVALLGEDGRVGPLLGTPPESPCLFPRMSLGDYAGGINQLFEIAMTDIMNSCGVTCATKVTQVTPAHA